MSKRLLTAGVLEAIVDVARLAPSVHNSQPWHVSADDNGIVISVDETHTLEDGDPTGRQTYISLGIFAEAVKIGAEANGLRVSRVSFNGEHAKVLVARSRLRRATDDVSLLGRRATDRSIYAPVALVPKDVRFIKRAWKSRDVKVWVATDRQFIEELAGLTSQGIGLALSNPSFRHELSQYLVLPWSKKTRGISVKSLYIPAILSFFEPLLMKLGVGLRHQAELEKERWLSASAVVLITSKGDLYKDWFEVGRAYLRVSLAIEQLNLSQATSAAAVEASTFHEDIEQMLGTSQRLQSSLRIGKGSKKRQYSPRVDTKTLLT